MRATRKPTLLFRLPVVFLLRFAARRFLGLLFQEPPRKTRSRESLLPPRLEPAGAKDRAAQTPRIGVFRVRDPGSHADQHFLLRDRPVPPAITETPQPVAETADVVFR